MQVDALKMVKHAIDKTNIELECSINISFTKFYICKKQHEVADFSMQKNIIQKISFLRL